MLIYDHNDKQNLTLDYFERGSISTRLNQMIQKLNHRNYNAPRSILNLTHFQVERTGTLTVYNHQTNPGMISILLFLSDRRDMYRLPDCKEKVFSSHVNIFTPSLRTLFLFSAKKEIQCQILRPCLQYKNIKIPLGKLHSVHFKDTE